MRFMSVIPCVFLGLLLGACSGDSSCVPHDSRYCQEGVTYWANSCGNLEEVIEQCQCGCLGDHSGCDPDCTCTPDCLGKECGDDGCQGSCPPGCMAGEHCSQGICECDFVACGSACCAQGQACYQGACCTPNCSGRECGADGCGGNCGGCGANEFCDADGQCQGMPDDCRQDPCPKGYYCDLNTGECKAGCISDGDCPQPGTCDLASHSCRCDSGYHPCSDQCLPNNSTNLRRGLLRLRVQLRLSPVRQPVPAQQLGGFLRHPLHPLHAAGPRHGHLRRGLLRLRVRRRLPPLPKRMQAQQLGGFLRHQLHALHAARQLHRHL
jgi:hypothetical protein